MSRFTPLRTATSTKPLSADQLVERRAYVVLGHGPHDGAAVLEQDEPQLAVANLLVAAHRGPRAVAVDGDRLRVEQLLDGLRGATGQPQRGEQPERDRLAVREAEVRSRLEAVGEGVAQVEDLA